MEDAEAPGSDWDEVLRNERINRKPLKPADKFIEVDPIVRLGRVLPSYLSSLLAGLVSKNVAVYEPAKQTRSVLLFWRQPEEWAEALHAWVILCHPFFFLSMRADLVLRWRRLHQGN